MIVNQKLNNSQKHLSVMSREVIVTTGSRLHWGLLSIAPLAGREFGGIGLMVDEPRLTLSVKKSAEEKDHIVCSENYISKIENVINMTRRNLTGASRECYYSVEVQSEIPQHCGFGSGTQLSLAVARAILMLNEKDQFSSMELAQCVQRGARSALGIHGFESGGFIVEGGKNDSSEISPLVLRVDFPVDWKVLLITPTDRAGISGNIEAKAIQKLGSMPVSLTDKLCRLILMQLIPSIRVQDFEGFSAGLTEYGHAVGEFFQPAQGGIFAHPRMAELENLLSLKEILGMTQTSWGPTLSVVCRDSTHAEYVSSILFENGYGEFCSIKIVKPLNRGAYTQLRNIA
ncbi:hypothetical protein V202x_52140 [Gimesia aquarii]|uniref:GHMP kinase N-terminal domain-containing protein n=2 Tax=Gimesia aquarii TaxID=2527964 RepID=A0A517X2Q6_9PLAN|nr:hypothetical protein V202x_52140 [Gimesia aquarii]